jgi:two-component system, OmpR family, sensor kinase
VTLAFAAVMAAVLFAIGLLIHARYENELNSSIDRGLRSRAGDVATLLRASNRSNDVLPNRAESFGEDAFAQVLTGSGRVLDTSGRSTAGPVLDRGRLSEAARGTIFFERGDLPGIDDRARLLASSVQANGAPLIVVVGTSTDDRNEALRTLATLLWLGGAGALLLASLAGYAAVTASLRPVEAIRRRAEEISAADLAQRLPVPAADDELKRLGETLNQMLARLETALERERAFVDDASHELRTPLALHRAELEVALRHAESPQELRGAITSAIEEVDRLSQLAEDLLVLARAGKGRLAVQRRRVELEPLMASVRDRFRNRGEASGSSIEVEPADGLAVDADRLRLEQALSNLLDNALRHGGGPIRLSARREGSRVQLHVCDSGNGFPADFLPRAFERFSRADEARTAGGTGLGLAIVEAIAAAHGGTVGAANLPDDGADVWIELPIDSAEPLSPPIHSPGVERAAS